MDPGGLTLLFLLGRGEREGGGSKASSSEEEEGKNSVTDVGDSFSKRLLLRALLMGSFRSFLGWSLLRVEEEEEEVGVVPVTDVECLLVLPPPLPDWSV